MATRAELLATFEAALNGFLLPASGTKDPPEIDDPSAALPQSSRSARMHVLPDNKSGYIEREPSLDGQHVMEHHMCYYWDTETLNGHNAHFYVIDRGMASEAAYWMQARDPKPPAAELTFNQRALAWLRALIGTVIGPYTVKYIPSVNVDEPTQTGTATVLVEQAGALKFIQVYLYRDAQGDVQWQVIPAA